MRTGAITVLAWMLPASFAAAQEIDCSNMGNLPQQPMNICAGKEFERADRALNVAWKLIRESRDKSASDDTLLAAQRAWLNYRKFQCQTEGSRFEGGSLQPFIVASCKTRITRHRTQELLLLAEDR